MSKHTPGPWVWTGKADYQMTFAHGLIKTWGPNNEYRDWEKHVVGGCGCCGSPFGVDDTEEMVANAYLIASAPDLLAALRGFLAEFGDKSVNNANVWAARAAIAKAEGRQ